MSPTHLWRFAPAAAATLALALPLAGQSTDAVNYVRDTAFFLAVPEWGPNPNNVEVLMTEDGAPQTLSFEEFLDRLDAAYEVGLGGTLNFEAPVYSDAYIDVDRTRIRAFISKYVQDHPPQLSEGETLQQVIDRGRALAYADPDRFDPAATRKVVDRTDKNLDDQTENPISNDIHFYRMAFLYGRNFERVLTINPGAQNIREGELARRPAEGQRATDGQGGEDLSTVNDTYFLQVGETRGGLATLPVSGRFLLLGTGVKHLLFDYRDNVQALGVSIHSIANFQHWQGLGGTPDNPDNLIVEVEFSDGTEAGTEYRQFRGTTAQSDGTWDMFYAFEAPSGKAITALYARVIGRNYRTWAWLDDLALVTAPTTPYLANSGDIVGTVGAPLAYALDARQAPDTITVSGLPSGLRYDAGNRLILGTPAASGNATVTVRLTNATGSREESLTLRVGPAADPAAIPELLPPTEAGVAVLGRAMTPLPVRTSLDETAAPGSLRFLTVVTRIQNDGSRVPSSLLKLGLSLADGQISGTPTRADQVGKYEVLVYATNDWGADEQLYALSIFPPVPTPNFDADQVTDLAVWDASRSTLETLAGTSYFDAEDKVFAVTSTTFRSLAGDVGSSIAAALGDLNGDIRTDFLRYDAASGSIAAGFLGEALAVDRQALFQTTPGSPWKLLLAADLSGDGRTDVLWEDATAKSIVYWAMLGADISKAGFLYNNAATRTLQLTGDFDGDAATDLLWQTAAGQYTLTKVKRNGFRLDGTADLEEVSFQLDAEFVPHLAGDLSGDGKTDLVWKNTKTGLFTAWLMDGVGVPSGYRPAVSGNNSTATIIPALPGDTLLTIGSPHELVALAETNNDQRMDLVLQNRATGALSIRLMDGALALAPAAGQSWSDIEAEILPGAAAPRVVAVGDYNADVAEDLVVRDSSGMTRFLLLDGAQVLQSAPLKSIPESARFLTNRPISTNLAIPAEAQRVLPPWQGAQALGDRWFQLGWFGRFFDPGTGWIVHQQHGALFVAPGSTQQGLWLYDATLGWLWTTQAIYPNLFQERNQFWLHYAAGSAEPRWFFNYVFDFWMMENEL